MTKTDVTVRPRDRTVRRQARRERIEENALRIVEILGRTMPFSAALPMPPSAGA
jgi:hypothetical protein